jgi:hypothetical protein
LLLRFVRIIEPTRWIRGHSSISNYTSGKVRVLDIESRDILTPPPLEITLEPNGSEPFASMV